MKRFLSIVFCLGLWQSPQALDRIAAYSPQDGLQSLAAVDTAILREEAESPNLGSARSLSLDAELLDPGGRRWNLQWNLFGGAAGSAHGPAGESWSAGVVLSAPDGRVHERVFAHGAGLIGRLTSAADDWEWHSRDAALLPARLRFDVDGREVILLLEALDSSGSGDRQAPSRIRVRGFVNLGIEKTYLSGRGQLQRDRQQMAGQAPLYSRHIPASPLPADRL